MEQCLRCCHSPWQVISRLQPASRDDWTLTLTTLDLMHLSFLELEVCRDRRRGHNTQEEGQWSVMCPAYISQSPKLAAAVVTWQDTKHSTHTRTPQSTSTLPSSYSTVTIWLATHLLIFQLAADASARRLCSADTASVSSIVRTTVLRRQVLCSCWTTSDVCGTRCHSSAIVLDSSSGR